MGFGTYMQKCFNGQCIQKLNVGHATSLVKFRKFYHVLIQLIDSVSSTL